MFQKNVVLLILPLVLVLFLLSSSSATPYFQAPQSYNSGGWDTNSVAIADVNGDGNLDLVVASVCLNNACSTSARGVVGILLGNGDGTFQGVQKHDSGGYAANSVAVADVNEDGIPDLIVSNYCGDANCLLNSTVGVLFGRGDGTFQAAQTYSTGAFNATSVAVGDVNGDGLPDLVVSNWCSTSENCGSEGTTPGSIGVLLGAHNGTFQPAQMYNSGGTRAALVLIADLNGDKKEDLIAVNQCSGASCEASSIVMLVGNGDGTFQPAAIVNLGGAQSSSLAIADVNDDGKLDILAGDYRTVRILLGNGDGSFQIPLEYETGAERVLAISVGDVNGDGKPDVITGSQCEAGYSCNSDMIAVLSGNGDGTFQAAKIFTSYGRDAIAVALADVNKDSRLDLLVANLCVRSSKCDSEGSAVVFLNKAPIRTLTTVVSNLNPSIYEQTITLTATVSSAGQVVPTGTVTFRHGATVVRTVTLTGTEAIINTRVLPAGTLAITATYNGDAQSAKSTSEPLSQVVKKATSTTTLASSVNPSAQGQPVTFTAKIASPTVTVTGMVSFRLGTTILGTVALAGGKCTFTTSTLPKGSDIIKAVYLGTPNVFTSKASLYQIIQ